MAKEDLFSSIIPNFVAVLTNPTAFFRDMPKQGGYLQPLVFMVGMAFLTAVVMAALGMTGLGAPGMMAMGLAGIIILPVLVAVLGFVGAAILFVIWKVMGSQENFETAYRCGAYAYAYAPVAALVGGIPYLGSAVGALWPMTLFALASIHVHGRTQKASWAVFGVLGVILALISVGGEKTARYMQKNAGNWQQQMESSFNKNGKEMSPEEAGKAVGDFLKGFQQSQDK